MWYTNHMKKCAEFVSHGEGVIASTVDVEEENFSLGPHAAWPEVDLPRDWGVNPGGKGAYEVPTMEKSLSAQLAHFKKMLSAPQDEVTCAVYRALEVVCGGRDSEKMPVVVSIDKRRVLLGVRSSAELFETSRIVVRKLQRVLAPEYRSLTFKVMVVSA